MILGPRQAELLEAVRRASFSAYRPGYVESANELRVLRRLEARGLVESRRGYWVITAPGLSALGQ